MIEFAPLDQMLQEYVEDGRVDYGRWQQDSARLDRWLASVQAVSLEKLDRETAIALLLNLYNALVIQQVLQKYPIDSIRPQILGVPNWISFLLFFKKRLFTLDGDALSLDGIEKGILRSRYDEPRIHFALVCASQGCPLLRAEAYWPDRLSSQLEEDAARFINNPDKVHYDAAGRTLYLSKIFKWYQRDFLTQADSIADYIQPYLKGTQLPADIRFVYKPYSWQLNQRTSS
ncbi:MAG: DUF547 domain-containing protein [Phormidesmis sp.]